jgi:hypothetical protein
VWKRHFRVARSVADNPGQFDLADDSPANEDHVPIDRSKRYGLGPSLVADGRVGRPDCW